MCRRCVVPLLVLSAPLHGRARAQDVASGEDLHRRALEALERGRIEDSRDLFERMLTVGASERTEGLARSFRNLLTQSLEDLPKIERRREGVESRRRALAESNPAPIVPMDGHGGLWISGGCWSPDGSRVLTWGSDGQVLLWNPDTGESLGALGRDGSTRLAARYSADGSRVLVLDRELAELHLWDPDRQMHIATVGGEHAVRAFDFRPDGRQFVTSDHLGRVRFWDAQNGRPVEGAPTILTPQPEEVLFDPGGTLLLTNGARPDGRSNFTASCGRVRVWDAASGELRFERGGEGDYQIGRWARRASRLVVHSGFGVDNLFMGYTLDVRSQRRAGLEVGVWDFEGRAREVLRLPTSLRPSRAPDLRTCFDDRAGRLLTVVERSGVDAIEVWDADSGELLQGWEVPAGQLHQAALSPGGGRAAIVTGTEDWEVRLLDVATGEPLSEYAGPMTVDDVRRHLRPALDELFYQSMPPIDPESPLGLASFGSRGTLSTVGESTANMVRLLDDGATVPLLIFDSQRWEARFSPDGHRLLLAGLEGPFLSNARVWSSTREVDLANHAMRPHALGPAVPGGGGSSVLHGGTNGKAFELGGGLRSWDPRTGADLGAIRLELRPGEPRLAWSTLDLSYEQGSGRVFASGAGTALLGQGPAQVIRPGEWMLHVEGRVGVPHLLITTGTQQTARVTLHSPGADEPLWSSPNHTHPTDVFSPQAVLHPDGGVFAMAPPEDGRLEIRSFDTGELVHALRSGAGLRQLVFSPDGRWLLTVGAGTTLWDTRTWEPVRSHATADLGWAGAFSPAGDRYAVSRLGGTALVASTAEPEAEPVSLTGHTAALRDIGFHPDGRRVLTTSMDGTARLWDGRTGETLRVFRGHAGPVWMALFVLDGTRLVTASDDGTFKLWDVESGALLQSRVLYLGDNWLAYTKEGWYEGTEQAAEWARIEVDGRLYPLSSYPMLRAGEHVAAAARGERVPPLPPLDSAPDVRVRQPAGDVLAEASFTLEVEAEGLHDIRAIRVWQDGEELDPASLPALEALRSRRGQRGATLRVGLTFPPSGRTDVRVRAVNDRGVQSWPETVRFEYAPPAADLYLVALGVETYDDPELASLQFAVDDARGIVERFARERGRQFREVHVFAVEDREVTTARLRRILRDDLMDAAEEDTIVIFAAGHGARDSLGDYYFLTSDASRARPELGISRADLEALVRHPRLAAARRLLLLDTCHAGVEFKAGDRGVSVVDDAFSEAEIAEAKGSGLYIVAASTEGGVAEERDGHGLFTAALLAGLDGGADRDRDGKVDVEELVDFTEDRVRQQSERQQVRRPVIEGGNPFRLATVGD